ncbi:MAG: type II toxin-antitoxin system PemK/MazF family toxin [Chloroflexi bacterium]|nr:type II toxin-antitoxin system PemK/MazF family toxin [Chloroflexota bacterium]
MACALSFNLKRAGVPGNVLLAEGGANLPGQSVVIVSQALTVDKAQLTEYIGRLFWKPVQQLFEGIKLLLEPREVD